MILNIVLFINFLQSFSSNGEPWRQLLESICGIIDIDWVVIEVVV